MRLSKKLLVVASVMVGGAGIALCFRKDVSPADPFQSAAGAMRRRIERRVVTAAPASAADRARPRLSQPPRAALHVSPAPASIPEPAGLGDDPQPTFQKSFHPVGTLLAPVAGVPDDDEPADPPPGDEPPRLLAEGADGETTTHTVADGDTLSELAIRYLGQSERYIEIFQLNRDVLDNPDLLPIGAVLKIPPRMGPRVKLQAPTDDPPTESAPAASPLPALVPVAPPSSNE